ncbi:MAG TPA: hypothetical protein VF595_13990 [Tepidisphaeraceae bacterium]|jgi:hypothetical protein
MPSADELLERQYLDMRARVLSLAADFDRLQRAPGGETLVTADRRLAALRDCLAHVVSPEAGRAERVQSLLSDKSD